MKHYYYEASVGALVCFDDEALTVIELTPLGMAATAPKEEPQPKRLPIDAPKPQPSSSSNGGCSECGSLGKRHKNGCSRAGGKKQASAAPRNDAISQMTFGRIKISQSHDVAAEDIARNLDIDVAEVEKAMLCETYSEYQKL